MNHDIIFETSEIRLTLNALDGRIISAVRNGQELITESRHSFSLQLLDRNGNAVVLTSEDFPICNYIPGSFCFSGCNLFPELSVKIRIRVKNQFIAFSNAVSGVPNTHVLEWIDAPQIHVESNRSLFEPLHDGVVITDPTIRAKLQPYHPIMFSKRGVDFGKMYPGRCMMQYMADYNNNEGIFFAAFDEQSIPKAMEEELLSDGTLRLSMQTFCGCGFGSGYSTPFEYVITGFSGDWKDAALIYRNWYDSIAPAKRSFPKWMEKSPVIVIYPVLGEGLDHGKNQLHTNCYYPYMKALPYIQTFNQEFDSSVMALLMHWEGTAPWAPPYVWPPLGGTELLELFRDALHKEQNLLGLYCSGTAWTQTSSITDYSQEERFQKEGLERFMLRGPKGEIEASVCNGLEYQRLGYDMCLCEEWSRRQVNDEVMKLARFGIDYCQYFDQNHGGGQHICYSHKHCHPPVPGVAQTDSVRLLLKELHDNIGSIGSEMVLGCESSAAEPFVNELQLNDARSTFVWWLGCPVPAQSFVFHGRTICFAGNQGGISWMLKYDQNPENLLFRVAYAFNAGDLLSVTLKENGHIHWGWGLEWNKVEPEQESILSLIRNLNKVRKKYPQHLLYGRMEIPKESMRCEKWTLKLADRDVDFDSVLYSEWSSVDGSHIQILTNYLPYTQTVILGQKKLDIPPLSAIVIEL